MQVDLLCACKWSFRNSPTELILSLPLTEIPCTAEMGLQMWWPRRLYLTVGLQVLEESLTRVWSWLGSAHPLERQEFTLGPRHGDNNLQTPTVTGIVCTEVKFWGPTRRPAKVQAFTSSSEPALVTPHQQPGAECACGFILLGILRAQLSPAQPSPKILISTDRPLLGPAASLCGWELAHI